MPALVLFKRRWKLGSDDLVIPAAILAAIHLIWTTILAYMLVVSENSPSDSSHWTTSLRWFVIGLMAIFPASLVLEVAIAVFSGRGGPLKTNMRSSVSTLLYLRLGLLGVELFWEILSMVRLFLSGDNKPSSMVLSIIGGFLLFNWLVTFTVIGQFGKAPPLRDNLKCSGVNPSCSFHPLSGDEVSSEKAAGKISMGGDGSGIYSSINEALCRGGAMSNSLIGQTLANNNDGDRTACGDRRFYGSHEICCFSVPSKRNSYSELERVISFTLSDLDLVQSDIIAGLVLFKRSQRSMQDMTIAEPSNEVYQFLSGTPITSTTRFLGFKSQGSVEFYSRVVRFMKYPLATHRLMRSTVFKKFRSLRGHSDGDAMKRCTCCQKSRVKNPKRLNSDRIQTLQSEPVEKELANLIGQKQFELLHCSLLNADLDGMSFLVGLDHEFKAVVVCVWSTICLKDAFVKMCSIKATSQCVIVRPDWFVSEYFAMLADKIYSRLRNDNLLLQALSRDQLSGTECYELIVTGQSMAGGVACVLAVLLKQFYHNLHCFAYAPPNSIFNAACVRETQSFITSIVVGKDVMPRLSCNQIEAFRQSLVSCLRSCNSHKLRILCSQRPSACCPDHQSPSTAQTTMEHLGREGGLFNKSTGLYLPGKVVHIVRSRPKISCSNRMSQCKRHSVFQAVWARNEDFKNILVSRKMISDHCPFLIMDALEKVLTHISPAKPVRKGVSGKRGHHRPMISANSSHNETTLTSQNTVSDFSTSEQLIESTYTPATLSMGPTEVPHPSVQEFFNQSMTLTGNVSEPHLGLEIPGPYERINNQTFPKVKMRSSRPSEFANRVIRIMPQQLSSNGGPSGQHTEGFYNIINVPNHFASMTSDSVVSNPTKIRTTATNHFLAGDQSNKRQPILIDNWTGAFAPLASPEALSESSSLASCGEQSSSGYPVGFVAGLPGHRGDSIKRLSSGAAYQRLVARIDPIRQSPLGPIHPFSGGWIDSGSADTVSSHKDLPQRIKKSSLTSKSNTGSLRSRSTNQEQGSVKGDEEQAKDLRDFNTFLSHDPHSKESYYAEIGEPSDCPSNHVAAPKSDSLYDLIMDASPPVEKQPQWEEPEGRAKADSDLMVFSPPSSGEHLRAKAATIFLSTADDRIHKDSIAQKEQQMSQQFESIALPVTTGSLFEHEPIYSKVIPRPERKYENPENVSKDVSSPAKSDLYSEPRRCLPEEKDVVVNNNTFFHDSDDDYEEAQEQFIYDLVIGHYSCAGRGYPHGFIESYSKTTHLSVAEEVAEPPPNIF